MNAMSANAVKTQLWSCWNSTCQNSGLYPGHLAYSWPIRSMWPS